MREDQVVVDLGKRMNKVLEIDEMLGSPLPNGDRDELECRWDEVTPPASRPLRLQGRPQVCVSRGGSETRAAAAC